MLNEKEKSELKKKNLELINEWVKEYCEDDFRCMVEHAFRYNGKDYRISASKKRHRRSLLWEICSVVSRWIHG